MLRKPKLWEIPVVNFFDRFILSALVTINCCDRLICTRFLGILIIHWLQSAADRHYYVCAFSCAIMAEETQSFHENHQLRMTQIIKNIMITSISSFVLRSLKQKLRLTRCIFYTSFITHDWQLPIERNARSELKITLLLRITCFFGDPSFFSIIISTVTKISL